MIAALFRLGRYIMGRTHDVKFLRLHVVVHFFPASIDIGFGHLGIALIAILQSAPAVATGRTHRLAIGFLLVDDVIKLITSGQGQQQNSKANQA